MTPGYDDEVIFGDGTFIDGSTAELSADGPLRPPWVVYCQVCGTSTLHYLLMVLAQCSRSRGRWPSLVLHVLSWVASQAGCAGPVIPATPAIPSNQP